MPGWYGILSETGSNAAAGAGRHETIVSDGRSYLETSEATRTDGCLMGQGWINPRSTPQRKATCRQSAPIALSVAMKLAFREASAEYADDTDARTSLCAQHRTSP